MKKFSIRPFGYKGKIVERRREAELFVETITKAGGKAEWLPWGKRFKIYYMKAK